MKMSNTIKSTLAKENITLTELANRLDISVNNLSNKLKRDNFKIEELEQIADAIGYDLDVRLKKKSATGFILNKEDYMKSLFTIPITTKDVDDAKPSIYQLIDDYVEISVHDKFRKIMMENLKATNKDLYEVYKNTIDEECED